MDQELFRQQNDAVRAAFAGEMGCDPAAFSREELTIVPRPEQPLWPFVAMIVGFGTGTVACVEQSYVDWATEAALTPHYRASYLAFLNPFIAEGARRGQPLDAQTAGLGWALATRPAPVASPDGYTLQRVDKSWMDQWQPRNVFGNGLGGASETHRTSRNQFACVLFNQAGDPAAVAGAFDTAGMLEIGIDVAREHRGRHLAPVVVSATISAILDAGKTPFYACATTNIRSQRTALASGFLPACSMAYVVPGGMFADE